VEQAIGYYEQALAIAQEIGHRQNEGNWLGNLGLAYRDLGQVEQAREYLEQALHIFEEIKSPHADLVRKWLDELDEGS
jgi:tetratricopeptide (TPR) repeat protein